VKEGVRPIPRDDVETDVRPADSGQAYAGTLSRGGPPLLLDREPKESILGRFDVTVISRYFPEFERELPRYLSGS
jgi:hypothetical protein